MAHHRRHGGGVESGDEEKPWDLKEDFKFAPKKPEDDPWKTLFDTTMDKERKKCDAWTNEIQNLLLFAGLFSGLVTAFILQSYKTLQPDPNADIVSLLSAIASGINNANSTAASPHSPLPLALPSSTFSASSTAVRVNICWFISLILSLTVVLSGIIAMQWLREHQSFTGQLSSSRDMLAILNMRIEALDHWHVHEIITTFPVILAAALVLFFAGMIQFLHILGNGTLLVAVASIISITLVLLSVSTVLPAAQCIAMYIWPLRQHPPPSPCPYKSPQSGIIHAICFYVSTFLVRRHRYFGAVGTGIRSLSKLNRQNKYALMYLTDTWSKKTWAEIDLCWLSVRQACVLPELDEYHRFVNDHRLPPLLDISKTFRDIVEGIRVSPDVLAAAYHCFHDLATPFAPRHNPHQKIVVKREDLDKTFKMITRRNDFLQTLLYPHDQIPKAHKNHESIINFGTVELRGQFFTNINILHHQNMFAFTDLLKNYHYAKELFHHRVELGIRLGHALFSRAHHTTHVHHSSFPTYLRGELFDQHRWKILKNDLPVQVVHQYALVLTTFFDNASHPDHQISDECLLAHKDTAEFLEKAAWDMFRIVTEQSLAKYLEEQDREKVVKIFGSILERMCSVFTLATEAEAEDGAAVAVLGEGEIGLKEKGASIGNGKRGRRPPANPVEFLYLAAIYVRRINSSRVNDKLETVMDAEAVTTLKKTMAAMLLYKRSVIDPDSKTDDSAVANNNIKSRLDGKDRFGDVARFSGTWWTFLEGNHDEHCEDSVGSVHGNPTHPTPARGSKSKSGSASTRRREKRPILRPFSSIIPLRASGSVGTQGTLPKYTEKEDYFFPQSQSPTIGMSRGAAPDFLIEEGMRMRMREGDGIAMVPVLRSGKSVDQSHSELSELAHGSSVTWASTGNALQSSGHPNRSPSSSFSKVLKTPNTADETTAVQIQLSSSSSSLHVRYPDSTYYPNSNSCVLSDDPYSTETRK